nr:hypothetical protein [Tanacetum cinerariifolium]
MQVNVQFLQQLQLEWSRFVTIVKQQHKLDQVSYHKLFDILKQYQKEVNEICAERIAKNANLLALVAAAQSYQDPYYQAPKSHKSYAPTSKASLQPDLMQLPDTKAKRKPKGLKTPHITRNRCCYANKLRKVHYDAGYNVFANERQQSEQPESISNTCVVEKVDSNVIPDLPDMCDNNIQTDQNVVVCDDVRVALANLIANLKLDVDENKKIQKQLKKANTTLAHELT